MSVSLMLWIGYHALALPLAVWAAVTACGDAGGRRALRGALPVLLLPCALAAAVLALPLARPELALAGLALPVLTLAAMVHNELALRDGRLLARLVHVPITAWNAALCTVFAIRVSMDLAGFDGGAPGAALVGAHATVQGWVGGADATAAPFWLHLPLCVPAGAPRSAVHALASAAASVVATAMLVALCTALPTAYQRAAGFRAPVADAVLLRDDQVLGARSTWHAPTDDLDALGAGAVVLDADLDLVRDETRVRRARDHVDAARASGRTVIVVARPSHAMRRRPASDVGALGEAMAQLHWLCAERLAPDLLVLFDGPFDLLAEYRAEVGTVDQWRAVIGRASAEVRQANPEVRTMVAIRSTALHARRLCAALRADDAPVDAVALIRHAETTPWQIRPDLFAPFEEWLRTDEGTRPVWLLDVGACAPSCGGEVGQWHAIARALAFAADHPAIAGVCVAATEDDGRAARGLRVPGTGRPRLALVRLAERRASPAAAPR